VVSLVFFASFAKILALLCGKDFVLFQDKIKRLNRKERKVSRKGRKETQTDHYPETKAFAFF
jgi:hypothetical protein